MLTVCAQSYILIDDNLVARIVDPIRAVDPTETMALDSDIPRYVAPEIFEGQPSTKEADIYSYGMIAWEASGHNMKLSLLLPVQIFANEPPFAEARMSLHVVRKVLDKERPRRPPQASEYGMTDDLWKIVERCWDTTPDTRPSAAQIKPEIEKIWPFRVV